MARYSERGVAPTEKTCDHGAPRFPYIAPLWPWTPNRPETPGRSWGSGTCAACQHSGVCMCVRPDMGARFCEGVPR